jgi:hypothetical protein
MIKLISIYIIYLLHHLENKINPQAPVLIPKPDNRYSGSIGLVGSENCILQPYPSYLDTSGSQTMLWKH